MSEAEVGSPEEHDARPPEKIRESIRQRRRRIDRNIRALESKLSPPEPVVELWTHARAGVLAAKRFISELAPRRHKGLTALGAAGLIGLAARSRMARYGIGLTAIALGIALARSRDSGGKSYRREESAVSGRRAPTPSLARGTPLGHQTVGESARQGPP